jgi:hypothetical protein
VNSGWRRLGRPLLLLGLGAVIALVVVTIARLGSASEGAGPSGKDFVEIGAVPVGQPPPALGPGASTGTVTVACGRDEEGHHNGDNLVTMPGERGGAHHTHDYVGNLSTNAMSTDASLAAAPTTCSNGDRSTYYWPVLRLAGDDPAEHGPAVPPAAVLVQYRGSPVSHTVPMPRFLRIVTGDAMAHTANPPHVTRVSWTCAGFTDRRTDHYPRCPAGHRLLRIFDFPSCWDGRHLDSPTHRTHVVFPAANGPCPEGTFPIPQLHIEVSYELAPGAAFSVDGFPEQRHDPRTDHAGFINVMTDQQMTAVVGCLNTGRAC